MHASKSQKRPGEPTHDTYLVSVHPKVLCVFPEVDRGGLAVLQREWGGEVRRQAIPAKTPAVLKSPADHAFRTHVSSGLDTTDFTIRSRLNCRSSKNRAKLPAFLVAGPC